MRKIGLLLIGLLVMQGFVLATPKGKTVTFPGKTLAPVVFDGSVHSEAGLKCKDCHPKIVAKMKAGANKIKMADINKGKFCGVCHTGKSKAVQAFAIKGNCARCHAKAEEAPEENS